MKEPVSRVHPQTPLAAVTLCTRDLGRVLPFYSEQLSLTLHEHAAGRAVLGNKETGYLHLVEEPSAVDKAAEAGLFHVAFLYPQREQLADALRSIAESGGSLEGVADHGVSHALYLSDPDGNGVELYYDLPRDQWPRDDAGNTKMYTAPLDVDGLLGARSGRARHRGAAALGHVHLRVSDIAESDRFYVDTLGFGLVQHFGNSAGFVSTAGYHHHIGYNTWQRSQARGGAEPRTGLTKLSLYTADDAAEHTDPDGIPVELISKP